MQSVKKLIGSPFARFGAGGLLKNASAYIMSNFLAAAVPFLLLPVLTRYLKPEEYGQVAMFQTTLAIFSALVGLQTAGAASIKHYDAHLDKTELKHFNGACLLILVASALVALFFLTIFEAQLSNFCGLNREWLLAVLVCAAANFITQLCMLQWQIRKKAAYYGAMQFAQAALNATLSLILVIALLQGAAGRINAQIVTSVVFAALAVLFLRRDQLLGFAWRPSYVREALEFGVPLLPHSFGIVLLGVFDRYVINGVMGEAEAGVYTVAVQFALPLGLLFTAFNNAYVPWLFERLQRDDLREKRDIVRLTYIYFFVALAFALAAFVFGPFEIRLVAGERYGAAGSVIGWIAVGQAFSGMYLMVTNFIFYSKKTGLLSLVTIGTGLLNVVLLYELTRRFGLVGAASASAAALGLRFLFTWMVAQSRHPMPWLSLKTLAQVKTC